MSCRNVFLENWNSEVMMVRINNNLSSWERSASPRQFSGYESMGATQQLVDAFRMNDGTAVTAEQERDSRPRSIRTPNRAGSSLRPARATCSSTANRDST